MEYLHPLPVPWQEFRQAILRHVGDTGENIGKPFHRVSI